MKMQQQLKKKWGKYKVSSGGGGGGAHEWFMVQIEILYKVVGITYRHHHHHVNTRTNPPYCAFELEE